MMEAQTILRMIEEVDPADTDKLDEIDARVFCFVKQVEYLGKLGGVDQAKTSGGIAYFWAEKYTRSRDALKAIRPEGWAIHFRGVYDDGKEVSQYIAEKLPFFEEELLSAWLPTEELAELHVIIQSIEHDRTNHTREDQ